MQAHLQFTRANAQTKNCKRAYNATTDKEYLANIKKIKTEMKKAQQVTKAICNAGFVLNIKCLALNKISSKLKVSSVEIPHYA